MRRNNMNNSERGGNFGGGSGGGGGGPILSNQLLDLDMELQLLKRKRELFEQEQNMLDRFTNSNKRQYGNKQPFNSYNDQQGSNQQFNFSSNYSNSYNAGNNARQYQQGNKRQSNTDWQNSSPPRRFNDSQKINPWQVPATTQNYKPSHKNFNSGPSKTFSAPPRPLMDIKPSIGQRIRNRYVPPPPRRDFRPTKVTKPNPKPANKSANRPSVQTKKLIEDTNKLIAQANKTVVQPSKSKNSKKKNETDNILRPHKQPSIQMKGRLELALGMIVKSIKELCPDSATLEFFMIPFIQRVIKHTLRVRIRNVMMNEPVDAVTDIVNKYRQKYPEETDVELMKVAQDAHSYNIKNQRILQLIEADDPEEFFRKNLGIILNNKLDEVFNELHKLYADKTYNIEECVKRFPNKSDASIEDEHKESEPKESEPKESELKESVPKEESPGDVNEQNEQSKKECNSTKNDDLITIDEKSIVEQLEEKSSKVKAYAEFMDKIIEQRLPKLLNKFRDLISILCLDKEFLGMKALIVSELKQRLKKSMKVDEVITIDEDEVEEHTETAETKASTSEFETATKPTPSLDSVPPTTSVKSRTPSASTVTTNVEVIEVETQAKETSETMETNTTSSELTAESSKTGTASKLSTPATPAKEAAKSILSTPKTPAATDLLYVKLIGRPKLPTRAVIYDFLNKFKPASIKKHKSINNLLVVGFVDKEEFENILNANETVIGDATLIIKASEQVINTPVQNKMTKQTNNTTPDHKKITSKEDSTPTCDNDKKSTDKSGANTAADDIIPLELETQITDLLSSIRKAGENEKTTPENQSDVDEKMDTMDSNNEILKSDASHDQSSQDKTIQIDTKNEAIDNSNTAKTHLGTVIEIDDDDDDSKKAPEDKVKNVEDGTKTNLKESGRATPTRSSSRLASVTPSMIKTRRASRLANN